MRSAVGETAPDDGDLVRAAQAGDGQALAVLLARHQASMRATAIGMLGAGFDADDAVQEASIIAVRRLSDLREPEKVGPWLRAVVRNAVKMQLRSNKPVPVDDVAALHPPELTLDPAALLHDHCLRDWLWHAIDDLPAEARLVTLLRYFTDVRSLSDIAVTLEVPVGTVKSRLHQARRTLHASLLRTAEAAHPDVGKRTEARRREAVSTLRAAEAGQFAGALAEHWSPDVRVTMPTGLQTQGFGYLIGAMERDLNSGVRQRLTNVIAGTDVVVWEADFVNPPEDPLHCPPSLAWVMSIRQERVVQLRVVHPRTRS
ncbi:RNA polymerase sigma-70 factor, ECF subfamily [Mycolicibacterium rutilum]|uniref:RNA polymerase sigma-70 factor, ECF subfamily n=1 Tax=Mycolicibacterium rutilum TaxID=370526 RepID=A0A1H6L7P0_MYCRU|nr:sigma-70 family RNA polymerase sigma factor [Mycolicibacterium rutilum]SEH84417.1 RNA polymerase sigma-70 factor, ECF subfamily [Mycolicibacterium rutilum]